MEKILIDIDVCLDSITGRYSYSAHADKVLQLAEEKTIDFKKASIPVYTPGEFLKLI